MVTVTGQQPYLQNPADSSEQCCAAGRTLLTEGRKQAELLTVEMIYSDTLMLDFALGCS